MWNWKRKRNTAVNSNVCPAYSKIFAQKSKNDRHVKSFHQDSDEGIVLDNQRDGDTQKETIPSMVLAIDTVTAEVSLSLPPEVPVPNMNLEEDVLPPNEQMEDLSSLNADKKSRLEQALTKIKFQLGYTMNLTESVVMKLKRDLKYN